MNPMIVQPFHDPNPPARMDREGRLLRICPACHRENAQAIDREVEDAARRAYVGMSPDGYQRQQESERWEAQTTAVQDWWRKCARIMLAGSAAAEQPAPAPWNTPRPEPAEHRRMLCGCCLNGCICIAHAAPARGIHPTRCEVHR